MKKIISILLFAGESRRFHPEKNKIFSQIDGKTVFEHSFIVFNSLDVINDIIIVYNNNDENLSLIKSILNKIEMQHNIHFVPGGESRQESVHLALKSIQSLPDFQPKSTQVLIHDGARCLITSNLIMSCIHHTSDNQGAILAVPVKDTIKQIDPETKLINKTLVRDTLWMAQTPQSFPFEPILNFYDRASSMKYVGTDDAQLAELNNFPVFIVESNYENIKITTADDLYLAQQILKSRK